MVAFRVTAEKLRHQDEILTAENEKLKVNEVLHFVISTNLGKMRASASVSHIYSS